MIDPIVNDPRVAALADDVLHPLVFATVSGAHLYGFASPDSDVDLRGCHLQPAGDFLGLDEPVQTYEAGGDRGGLDADVVSHDLRKFARMLAKRNGYVLEQLTSPLVVRTSPLHRDLLALVPRLVTRRHGHHYLGFAATQRRLLERESPPRAKPLLYLYRVLLTGLRLVRTGEVEANLPALNAETRLAAVDDLIALKRAGREKQPLPSSDFSAHLRDIARLTGDLEAATTAGPLPEVPPGRDDLDRIVRDVALRR